MTTFSLEKELKENSYPGRGIVETCGYCIFYYGKKREQQKPYFC